MRRYVFLPRFCAPPQEKESVAWSLTMLALRSARDGLAAAMRAPKSYYEITTAIAKKKPKTNERNMCCILSLCDLTTS